MTLVQKGWIQGLSSYQYGSQKSLCTGHKASLIAPEILTPIQISISEFEVSRWHNSRACVWYFQVCKFQFYLLAKYLISVNSGIAAHTYTSVETVEEKLRNRSFAVSQILHLSGAKALLLTSIGGFSAPGLRKLSWHTPEVPVHEETFQDKTCGIMMAILKGQDGPDIPMMGCIPTNDSTVFTCAGHWGGSSSVCLKFSKESQIFRNTPTVKRMGCSTMAVLLCKKGNLKRFLYMRQPRSFSFPIRVSYKTTLRAKEWGWENVAASDIKSMI